MSYNDVTDWLGPQWEDGLGVYNSYLGMNPGLFEAGREFVQWAQQNNKLPSGSTTIPATKYLVPSYYINNGSITINNNTTSFSNVPVYPLSSFEPVSNTYRYATYKLDYIDPVLDFPLTLWPNYGTETFFDITVNSTPYTMCLARINNISPYPYTFGTGSRYTSYIMNPGYLTRPSNGTPAHLIFITYNNSSATPAMYYQANDSNFYLIYLSGVNIVNMPFVNNNGSVSATSNGVPQYLFNNTDRIYIDLQQGDLTSVLTALQNLILQVNQNLVAATIALQEASASDLPVDTTPFIQLVQTYENLTNDCISGTISVTSALSSMYTLLSSSISSITNASLENACISAYNAFVNKLALFQSSGGSSQSIGNYENVQDLQSDLQDLIDSYNSGQSTISQTLTSAATLLDTYMSNASGMQEVIGLQNAYNLFLNDLGFELNLSSNAQSIISDFNDTLDDYFDGTITRKEAIGDLRTTYRNGITGSMTATDVGAITTAFQSALDQITVNELNISEAIGEVSADTIALEGDLIEMLDFTQLSAYFNFESWEFFPDTESNLYREYFQRFLATTSPFYEFLYYPLILGVAGLILGTTIRFGVKARRSRGSTSSKSGGDE